MKKLVFIVIFITGFFFNSFGDESDGHWVSMGELSFSKGSLHFIEYYDDYLYVAGNFSIVQNIFAKNVAKLHIPTGKWETLNYENGSINAIAIGSDGNFYTVGGICNAYKFEANRWEDITLGGKCERIDSIAVDKNNTVFVGGSFDIGINGGYGLVKWENDEWQETGFYYSTSVLAKDYSENIYAGSRTYGKTPDDFYYFSIGKYNENSWEIFETLIDSDNDEDLRVLAVDEKGIFYIFNKDLSIGTLSPMCILKSDGTSWSEVDGCISCDSSGVDSCNILKMKFDRYGNLFIAGDFLKVDNTVVNNIAFWNGTEWSDLNGGTDGTVEDFTFDDDGNLYALGVFSQAGGINAKYLAKWDGTKWSAVFNYKKGYEHQVTALIKDSKGNIYAGGNFISGDKSSLIAKFDGKKLTNLGNAGFDSVTSLTLDNSENLYAAGYFNKSDSGKTYSISKWNGTEWKQVGDNFNFIVNVLAGNNYGNLYAGGAFTKSGEISLNHIAKWNGTKWANLGSGIETPVLSMAFNKSGDLFAGGGDESFQYNSVFKWNGQNWDAIGSFGRVNGTLITSLAFDSMGNLYAGGDFWEVDGKNGMYNIAKWNGKSWSAVGGKIKCESDYSSYCIRALAVDSDDNLYAGGYFYGIDNQFNPNFAKWNGTKWVDVNGGTNGPVNALAIDENNAVFVGGNFSAAGYQVSPYLAKYVVNEIPPDDDIYEDNSDQDTDIAEENDIDDNDVESDVNDTDTETAKKDNSGCTLFFL